MEQLNQPVKEALLQQRTSGEFLAELFKAMKDSNPRLSHASFGKRIGIRATTPQKVAKLVGDIFHGRRKLAKGQAEQVIKVYGFDSNFSLYFRQLVSRDLARSPKEKDGAGKTCDALREMQIAPWPLSTPEEDNLALKVLTAFGFGQEVGVVARKALQPLVAKYSENRIAKTLQRLEQSGIISVDPNDQIRLERIPHIVASSKIVAHSLRESAKAAEELEGRPELTLFMGHNICIRREEVETFLADFRKLLLPFISQSSRKTDADSIYKIVLGVYPEVI